MVLFVLSFSEAQAGDYFKKDKLVLDFYSPTWLNTPNTVKSYFDQSIGFSCTWGRDNQIKHSLFSIFYGLSYDYNKVSTNANLQKPDFTLGHPDDLQWYSLSTPYDDNDVKLHYVDVPFELRFRTQTKYPFRLYLGMKVGYLFSSKYTLETPIIGEYSRSNIKEINHFRYGVTARVGYGMFNVYSYYGLDQLLANFQNKRIHQFSIGLSLLIN